MIPQPMITFLNNPELTDAEELTSPALELTVSVHDMDYRISRNELANGIRCDIRTIIRTRQSFPSEFTGCDLDPLFDPLTEKDNAKNCTYRIDRKLTFRRAIQTPPKWLNPLKTKGFQGVVR